MNGYRVSEIITAMVALMRERDQKPKFILLGSQAYFDLCDDVGARGATEFHGLEIVVHEAQPEAIQVIEGPFESATAMTPYAH
jgi:hypothetical protein